MQNVVEKTEARPHREGDSKIVASISMKENSSPLVQFILLFAVGIIVLMNFFEVRKLNYSFQDSIDSNKVQLQQIAVKVRDIRGELAALQLKINSAVSQLAK